MSTLGARSKRINWCEGLAQTERTRKVTATGIIENVAAPFRIPDVLEPEEISSLIQAAARSTKSGVRSLGIIHLMLDAGLRAGEVLDLKSSDINWQMIAVLNEQKQTIIHRAVIRGHNVNVRLKPSGIAWLGEVPENW